MEEDVVFLVTEIRRPGAFPSGSSTDRHRWTGDNDSSEPLMDRSLGSWKRILKTKE